MFEKQNSGLSKGTASTSDAPSKSEQEDKKIADSEDLIPEETGKCKEPESPQPKRHKTDNWEFNRAGDLKTSLSLLFSYFSDGRLSQQTTDPQRRNQKQIRVRLGESSSSFECNLKCNA